MENERLRKCRVKYDTENKMRDSNQTKMRELGTAPAATENESEERQNNMQGKQEAETYDKRRKDRKIKN